MLTKKSTLCVFSALLIIMLVSSTASASPLNAAVYQQSGSSPQKSIDGNGLDVSDTFFFEDFESFEENSYPSSFTQIYNGCGDAEQKVITTVGFDETDSKVFRLSGCPSWASEHYVSLPSPLPEILVVDAYVKPVSGSFPGGLRLRNPSGTWGTEISGVIFTADGNITAGGSVIGSYTMGNWYHVRMEHNIAQNKYAVYINGIKLAEDLNMFATLSPTQLELLGGNSGTNEIYFDNVGLFVDSIALSTCTPPPPDMVSWWGGDNNALDMVSGNHGTLMGDATYTSGKVGKAFSFDGAEPNFVEIPDSAEFNPSGAFSVDGWFYIDPAAVGNVSEIATLVAKSEGSLNDGWALYFDDRSSTKSLKFVLGSMVEEVNAISTANWYHITGVYDPMATPRATLYLNGVNVADSGSWTGTVSPNSLNVRIGAMYWTDSYHQGNDRLNGKADEVEYFNRALSGDEISAIYNASSAGKCRSCTPPPANMVSWWPGENNANDIIGTNNGALVNGVTFAPGMVGQAFSFDGVDDYVEVPHASELLITNGLTLDAWFKLRTARQSVIFFKGDANGTDPLSSYGLSIEANGSIASILFGNYPADIHWTDGGLVVPNQWYHIALTWDGKLDQGNNVLLYLNGSLVQTWTKSSIPLNATTQSLSLGSMKTPTYYGNMDGLIDEPEIFNRALTSSEIAAIYNAGSAGECRSCTPPPANIVSWWPGESNANDIIGTNNGALVNGVTFAPGKVGEAFSFDGVDDYVQVPDAPSLTFSPTSPLTIYMWAYPTTNGVMHLLGKRGTCWDSGQSSNYQIAHDSANGISFNSGGTQLLSGQQLLPNQWQHIALTADGSTFRIYMDGQEKGSVAGTLGGQNSAPLDIGGVCSDVGAKFPGLLDDVTIVNRALNADEIAAIYNAGNAGTCTPDIIYNLFLPLTLR